MNATKLWAGNNRAPVARTVQHGGIGSRDGTTVAIVKDNVRGVAEPNLS